MYAGEHFGITLYGIEGGIDCAKKSLSETFALLFVVVKCAPEVLADLGTVDDRERH
jgi:hypothetical protein